MNYFEEIELMSFIAEEVGVLYQHPLDETCVVFRTEDGIVAKLPKEFLDDPKLNSLLLEKYQ